MINKFDGQHSFLSNFFIDTLPNLSVENRYQATKTEDPAQKQAILSASSPALAKKLGRKVTMRPDWNEIKYNVMWELLWRKFQVPFLKELLLSTKDEPLIEGNYWHDNYWGMCNCQKCINKQKYNHLGRLLMSLRTIV